MADSNGVRSETVYAPLPRSEPGPELSSSGLERMRRALIARYGADLGGEAYAEAAAFAAGNRGRVAAMANPVGYLYRVGQSRLRSYLRWRRRTVSFEPPATIPGETAPWIEPGLPKALGALSERQRVCLILIVVEQWTYAEVADLLEISRASVQTHVDRAKASIRADLGVDDDDG